MGQASAVVGSPASAATPAPDGSLLVGHGERSRKTGREPAQGLKSGVQFCEAPSTGVRWLFPDGRVAPVRCGRSNACRYCAMLAALENAHVLGLDAAVELPTVALCTTTALGRSTDWHGLREAEHRLWERLRRRYGRVEYCGFLEWTTGRSRRSQGQRLPHLHHLVKGVPVDGDLERLEREARGWWQRYTGDAWRVDLREITSPAGAVRYFVMHHEKTSQAPPPGTKHTKRMRPSKGYFGEPGRLAELRKQAAAELADVRLRRVVQRWYQHDPYAGWGYADGLEAAYETARAEWADARPELITCSDAGGPARHEHVDELLERTQAALRLAVESDSEPRQAEHAA